MANDNIAAELETVYEGIRNADANGDTEGVRRLAAYAETLRSRQYSEQRRAETQQIQAGQATMREKIGKGLAEAPKRLLENFQQLGAAVGEAVGYYPEGAVAQQQMDMQARRLAATQGDTDVEQTADIGEVALLSVPGLQALRSAKVFPALRDSTRLLPTLGRTAGGAGAAAGVASGASETALTPEDVFAQRAGNAAVAGGFAGSVGMLAALGPMAHNFLVRMKQKAQQNEAQIAARSGAGTSLDNQTLTLSQETGNVVARSLETQVQATRAQNFFNKQFEKMANHWETLASYIASHNGVTRGAETDFLTLANRVSAAWKKSEASAQAAASRLYGARLARAGNLAQADKAPFPVPFDSTREAVETIAQGSGRDWWRNILPGAERPSHFIGLLDDYLKAIDGGGHTKALTVQEMLHIRRNLNQMDSDFYEAVKASPDVSSDLLARHKALKTVIDAVDDDIDSFLKTNPADRPAVQALREFRDANSEYREFKNLQDYMRSTATAQWFGGRIVDNPEKALVQLAGMEPAQQTILVNTLRQSDPEAIGQLKVALVDRAIKQMHSAPTRRAGRGPVDVDALARGMMGEDNVRVLGERIFSPAEYAKVTQGLAGIRVLQEAAEGTISVNRGPGIESGFMAMSTFATAFLARAAYRLGGAGSIEKLLFTKEGLESLNVLRDLYRGSSKWKPNQIAKAMTTIGTAAGMTDELPDDANAWITGGQ